MTKLAPSSLEYQKGYFSRAERTARIAIGETPTVRRHIAATLDPLALAPGSRVLELGCGMGRFTGALLSRGYRVTALDLSDYLTRRLREELGPSPALTVVTGRSEDAEALCGTGFDAVVGFFFLHHLRTLAPTFDAIRRVLRPGGRVAFCEPNAFNPLVYLQVTFTPGMSWTGEPAIPQMRPSVIGPLLTERGFDSMVSRRYGMLPPAIANHAAGAGIERSLERLAFLRPFSAYRTFHASLRRRA